MAIWRGGLTWDYHFIHQDQREVIKNSLFMQESWIDCFYREDTKKLSCDRFKKQIEKKSLKKVVIGSKNKVKKVLKSCDQFKKQIEKKFKKSCDWFTWPCRCPFRAANASRGSYNSFLSENICQLSFSICIRICTSNLKWRIWLLLYRICANIFLNLFYPANRSLLGCACISSVFVFHIYFSFLFRESFANQSC